MQLHSTQNAHNPNVATLLRLWILLTTSIKCMLFATSYIPDVWLPILSRADQPSSQSKCGTGQRSIPQLYPAGRVFGGKFAEMPFVATKAGYRREGNCKRLLKVRSLLLTNPLSPECTQPPMLIRSLLNNLLHSQVCFTIPVSALTFHPIGRCAMAVQVNIRVLMSTAVSHIVACRLLTSGMSTSACWVPNRMESPVHECCMDTSPLLHYFICHLSSLHMYPQHCSSRPAVVMQ